MALRIVAFRALAALAFAGFASAAVPAPAQAQVACGYPCAYTVVVPQPQYQCGSCGNRGLFTSTWVQPAAPCGYNPCQQVVVQQQYYRPAPQQYYQPAPQQYYRSAPQQHYQPATQQYSNDDDDDDTNVGYTDDGYRRHRYVGTGYRVQRQTVTTRHAVTSKRSGAARQCGYVNGKWHCVGRVSQNQQKPYISSRN